MISNAGKCCLYTTNWMFAEAYKIEPWDVHQEAVTQSIYRQCNVQSTSSACTSVHPSPQSSLSHVCTQYAKNHQAEISILAKLAPLEDPSHQHHQQLRRSERRLFSHPKLEQTNSMLHCRKLFIWKKSVWSHTGGTVIPQAVQWELCRLARRREKFTGSSLKSARSSGCSTTQSLLWMFKPKSWV